MAKKRYGRIILSWLFAIIMMISNILPAFATGSADSQSLKIKVTVVNASDENQYLEGNGITLKSLFSSYEETKYTDEKGSVEFTGLAPGKYQVIDSDPLPGWKKLTTPYTYDLSSDWNFTIQKESLAEKVALTLESVDNDDKSVPVGNIAFELHNPDGTVSNVKTDASGKCLVGNVVQGQYYTVQSSTVEGYKLDKEPFDFDVLIPDDKEYTSYAITVKIPILKDKGDSGETKKGTANISLKTKTDSNPISGAEFTLYDSTDDSAITTGTTGSNGMIKITDLEVGKYYFKITKVPEKYLIDTNEKFEFEITKTNIEFNLNLTVDVKDEVTDGTVVVTVSNQTSGDSISGVTIKLISGSTEITGTTDASGIVRFAGLAFGTYKVSEVSVPDPYILSDDVHTVTVSKEKPTCNFNIRKIKSTDVKGTVNVFLQDADTKEAIANAKLALYKKTGEFVMITTTDAAGKVTITDLAQGDYYFTEDQMPENYSVSDKKYEFSLKDRVLTVNLTLQKAKDSVQYNSGYLKVTVTDQDDTSKPVVGATLSLLKEDLSIFGTYKTNSSGQFEVKNIPLGTYYVSESTMPYGYNISKNKTTVTFTKGQPKVSLTFRKIYSNGSGGSGSGSGSGGSGSGSGEETKTGAINVTIVDKDKQTPISGATISFYKKDGTHIATKISDENGVVKAENLALEEYYFTEDSMPAGYSASQTKHSVNLTKFNVYNIKLEKAYTGSSSGEDKDVRGSIKVKVVDATSGTAIPNMTLVLTSATGDFQAEFVTDNSGCVTFNDLTMRKYFLTEKAVPTGYTLNPEKREIDLSVSQFEVTLKKATSGSSGSEAKTGTINVTIVDQEKNTPIQSAVMSLYKADGSFVGDYTVDANGKISINNLELTEYYLKEKRMPDGYTVSDKHYQMPLTKDIATYTFTLSKLKKSSGSQTTTTTTTGTFNLNLVNQSGTGLANATIAIYKQDGTLVKTYVTDANGKVSASLAYGSYYMLEKIMPTGYPLSSQKYEFTLSDSCVTMTFDIKKYKTSSSSGSSSSGGSSGGGSHSSSSSSVKTTTGGPNGSSSSVTPISDGTWKQDSNGRWWYQYDIKTAVKENITYPKNKWVYISSNSGTNWYYFGNDGFMKTGWIMVGNNWYYLNRNGALITNTWFFDGSNWYHIDASGKMETGWILSNNRWYYLNTVSNGTKGAMLTGWQYINGKWYYLNPVSDGTKGALYVNTVTPDGYRVNGNGEWVA